MSLAFKELLSMLLSTSSFKLSRGQDSGSYGEAAFINFEVWNWKSGRVIYMLKVTEEPSLELSGGLLSIVQPLILMISAQLVKPLLPSSVTSSKLLPDCSSIPFILGLWEIRTFINDYCWSKQASILITPCLVLFSMFFIRLINICFKRIWSP